MDDSDHKDIFTDRNRVSFFPSKIGIIRYECIVELQEEMITVEVL
jgi:hypothetical protein